MSRYHQAEAYIGGARVIDDSIGRADIGSIKFGIAESAVTAGSFAINTGISSLSGMLITHEHDTERTGVILTSVAGSSTIANFSAGIIMTTGLTATVNWVAFGVL